MELWSKGVVNRGKEKLEKEILSYRKPAALFPSFKESVITRLIKTSGGMKAESLTYDRYEVGYDFIKEHEHRIVFDEGVDYLYFDEIDIYMIITPNSKAKENIERFLAQTWKYQPIVKVFPS